MEELPSDRTAAFVPEFAVKDLPLGRTLKIMMMMMLMITGDECSPNFLAFVLRLRENPGKISTRKLTRPGIEPESAA